MKQNATLYNIMLPIWFIFFFPTQLWLLILPANFLVDLLVVSITKRVRHVEVPRPLWYASIFKVWVFGFVADFIGAGVVLLLELLFGNYLNLDTAHFPGLTLISIPGVIVAGVLIYVFNRYVSYRRCGLDQTDVKALALALAITTAPYTMLIPVML